MRITSLDPVQGFAAEFSAAGIIQVASELGIPISTTHTITSAILGVGNEPQMVRCPVGHHIRYCFVLGFNPPGNDYLGRPVFDQSFH